MANTTKAGIIALGLGLAALSAAQTNGPTGYSVRIGAFFPNSGTSNINIGLDYKLNSVAVPAQGTNPSYVGLSIDYYGDADSYAIPLAVTYNVRAAQNFVAFAGIGLDYSKGNNNDATIGFAAQLGASYEFAQEGENRNPIFVQAKYFFSREEDLRGFAVTLGYRF